MLVTMYERISDEIVSVERFIGRVLKHAAYVVTILALSVLVGACGFMLFEGQSFEDAILHSAYILSGFGLVQVPASYPGKLFAGVFGLYASLFFLAAFSVIFAPVVHRILHRLHLEDDSSKDDPTNRSS